MNEMEPLSMLAIKTMNDLSEYIVTIPINAIVEMNIISTSKKTAKLRALRVPLNFEVTCDNVNATVLVDEAKANRLLTKEVSSGIRKGKLDGYKVAVFVHIFLSFYIMALSKQEAIEIADKCQYTFDLTSFGVAKMYDPLEITEAILNEE